MIIYHVGCIGYLLNLHDSRVSQNMWFFTHFVREQSQLLTDPNDVNLTDNQCSIHDKFYQYKQSEI